MESVFMLSNLNYYRNADNEYYFKPNIIRYTFLIKPKRTIYGNRCQIKGKMREEIKSVTRVY